MVLEVLGVVLEVLAVVLEVLQVESIQLDILSPNLRSRKLLEAHVLETNPNKNLGALLRWDLYSWTS